MCARVYTGWGVFPRLHLACVSPRRLATATPTLRLSRFSLPLTLTRCSHETETDTDGVNFKAYNARFWMPAVNNNGPSNGTWYR
jgi:hypothetical protein